MRAAGRSCLLSPSEGFATAPMAQALAKRHLSPTLPSADPQRRWRWDRLGGWGQAEVPWGGPASVGGGAPGRCER